MMKRRLLIWWTNGRESDAADEMWLGDSADSPLGNTVPDYLLSELHSRSGRAGRGRLWVPEWLSEVWAPDKGVVTAAFDAGGSVAEDLRGRSCGGIVFHPDDLPHVARMPGYITDLRLEVVHPELGDFGWALNQLRDGRKVCRLGWDGVGVYLVLSNQKSLTAESRTGESNYQHGPGALTIGSRIDIRAADGVVEAGWRPTSRDMLAEDWTRA